MARKEGGGMSMLAQDGWQCTPEAAAPLMHTRLRIFRSPACYCDAYIVAYTAQEINQGVDVWLVDLDLGGGSGSGGAVPQSSSSRYGLCLCLDRTAVLAGIDYLLNDTRSILPSAFQRLCYATSPALKEWVAAAGRGVAAGSVDGVGGDNKPVVCKHFYLTLPGGFVLRKFPSVADAALAVGCRGRTSRPAAKGGRRQGQRRRTAPEIAVRFNSLIVTTTTRKQQAVERWLYR
jgi:hypothetical protein